MFGWSCGEASKNFWVPDCLGNDDGNKANATSSMYFLGICFSVFG